MRNLVKLIFAFVAVAVFLIQVNVVQAKEANNKYGIHIFDEADLPDAAELVNGGGGSWGYVTMVIREDERDATRWQGVFDQMRRLKIIPIIRIATRMEETYWAKPSEHEAANWAAFLNSLNWPTQKKHVILFNEPNHAKEWGGQVDPSGFAKIYRHYYTSLKEHSEDFVILPGALDLAAPNSAITMEASNFFEKMHQEDAFIFTLYEALNSHSYPNPGFSGKITDTGKMSIRGYQWELDFLSNFGLKPEVPVYITETGWLNSTEDLEQNYKTAFEDIWSDSQIVAITPFLLSYQNEPFDSFSWKNPQSGEYYPQYYAVQSIAKQKGTPAQKHSFELISENFADQLVSDSEYSFTIELKNTGQSIWQSDDGFKISASGTMDNANILLGDLPTTEPGQTAKLIVRLQTSMPRGIHRLNLSFYKEDIKIGDILNAEYTLLSPPSFNILAQFWFGDTSDNLANLEMYDDETLVTKYDNLAFVNGKASIDSVKNIIPNKNYEFILRKPYFAPAKRQAKVYSGEVEINFGRLIPIDLNNDGGLSVNDILSHIINPVATQLKLIPSI